MPAEFGGFAPQFELPEQRHTPEDQFYALADAVDAQTRATKGFQRIEELVDESGDFTEATRQLRQFLDKRNQTLDTSVSVEYPSHGEQFNEQAVKNMLEHVRFLTSVPERFLGNGAAAEVYTFRSSHTELDRLMCAKIVTNAQRQAEGNSITKEMWIQDALRDLKVNEVRVPEAYFSFSTTRMQGMLMEHLDAVNLRRVLEGQTTEGVPDTLPPTFDIDRYFQALEAFVEQMHARGIYHNDLYLRNLMVDRVTGMPYVIDFGKATLDQDIDKTKTFAQDPTTKDQASMAAARDELKKWLETKES